MDSMEVANDHTIFVGGLPRDTTAETLAMKLEAKFGGVSGISIDLDSDNMYPRGTAVVVFKEKVFVGSKILVMKQGKKFRLVSFTFNFWCSCKLFQIEMKPFLQAEMP